MRRSSIRRTLLLWYGLVLTGVLITFGTILYREASGAVMSRHDALIESRSAALAAGVDVEPGHDGGSWELELSDEYLRAIAETTYFCFWDDRGRLRRSGGVEEAIPLPEGLGFRDREGRREHVTRSKGGGTVLVGVALDDERTRVRRLLTSVLGAGVAVLLIALAGGWWLAGRTMEPIARMSDRAAQVSSLQLSVRLDPDEVPHELRGLCGTLNEAFARLEEAFARQTRFTADASHELRTPLAVVRTQVEQALRRPRSEDEYRACLQACLRAVERMTGLVEGLLTLARTDSGAVQLDRTTVRLDQIVRVAADTLAVVAAEKRVSVNLDLLPTTVTGDAEKLGQVATNLISNALRYNHEGGRVDITLRASPDHVDLVVADTGVGVPLELREKIFERFFRVDPARAAGGAGLGLSIVRSLLDAQGAHIDVTDRPEGGTVFTVRFPQPRDPGLASGL